MRLFVAINIPTELKKVIEGLQHRLRASPQRISWVRPDNIHLTLKFLGEVDEAQSVPLIESLAEVSAEIKSFKLCSDGLGAFPSMRAPRALWLGICESTELTGLKKNMESALSEEGFEKDTKKFSPHLTICRIRSKKTARAMSSAVEGIKVEKKVAFVVNRFVLYRSILSPTGARYEIIRAFPLRDGHT